MTYLVPDSTIQITIGLTLEQMILHIEMDEDYLIEFQV